MPGASKLVIPKAKNSAGMLRKPTATSSSKLLMRKTNMGGKPRINKLSMKLPISGSNDSTTNDDEFEDIEETQKKVAEAERATEEDEALVRKLGEELNVNNGSNVSGITPTQEVNTPSQSIKSTTTKVQQVSSKDENLAKLKSMTSDFWAQM